MFNCTLYEVINLKAMETHDKNNILELFNTALNLEKAKKKEEAIHVYEEIIDMKDDFFDTYIKLGSLYENTDQDMKAREVYKKGIRNAKRMHNENAKKELSYTLLGLLD